MLSPENRDRADLKALLERVEKAEGADRELDAEIAATLMDDVRAAPEIAPGVVYHQGLIAEADLLTASIDAALALLERCLPDVCWRIGFAPDEGGYRAKLVTTPPAMTSIRADAETPALAVLAALLTALIEQPRPTAINPQDEPSD